MVVNNYDVNVFVRCGFQRVMARGAAINGNDEVSALIYQLFYGLRIGPVAFEYPVGNVDAGILPMGQKQFLEQRRGCGTINIIIALIQVFYQEPLK